MADDDMLKIMEEILKGFNNEANIKYLPKNPFPKSTPSDEGSNWKNTTFEPNFFNYENNTSMDDILNPKEDIYVALNLLFNNYTNFLSDYDPVYKVVKPFVDAPQILVKHNLAEVQETIGHYKTKGLIETYKAMKSIADKVCNYYLKSNYNEIQQPLPTLIQNGDITDELKVLNYWWTNGTTPSRQIMNINSLDSENYSKLNSINEIWPTGNYMAKVLDVAERVLKIANNNTNC